MSMQNAFRRFYRRAPSSGSLYRCSIYCNGTATGPVRAGTHRRPSASKTPAVIDVENLRKGYRGHAAVEDVSFSVGRARSSGSSGPTTPARQPPPSASRGFRKPDGGTIRVPGLDPTSEGAELRQRVSAQLQKSELPENLRVLEGLEL